MNVAMHVGPIDHFEVRYSLDSGLGDARVSRDWHDDYPATRAGLALALDKRDYECLSLVGQYGAASAYLVAVMGDGVVRVGDEFDENGITEGRALDLLTVDGDLDPDDVFSLHDSVWDGHNHVPFVPSRSLAWLTREDAYERKGYALVQWNSDGGIDDIAIDDGWEIADEYWGTLGNESWSHGQMDCDKREEALDAAGISYNTVWLSDDDVMILVPTTDVEKARLIMEAGDGD